MSTPPGNLPEGDAQFDPDVKIVDPAPKDSIREIVEHDDIEEAAIRPIVVISDVEEEELLAANVDVAKYTPPPSSAMHNTDEDIHNDDPDAVIAPPQKGESKPADLDKLIEQERLERQKMIEELSLG